MNNFIRAIVAGFLIGIGCITYLSIPNHYVGSALFSLGLLAILNQSLNLYTGKIGFYRFNLSDSKTLFIMLLGNLLGAALVGSIVPQMSLELISTKLNKEWYEILFNSWACGALMYTAVRGYLDNKILITIFAIMVFILCGFDHCIANYFYMVNSSIYFDYKLLIMILGNSIGSWTLSKI